MGLLVTRGPGQKDVVLMGLVSRISDLVTVLPGSSQVAAPKAPNAPTPIERYRVDSYQASIKSIGKIGAGGYGVDWGRAWAWRSLFVPGWKLSREPVTTVTRYTAAPGVFFPGFVALTPCFSYNTGRPTDSQSSGRRGKLPFYIDFFRGLVSKRQNTLSLGPGFQALARY